MASKFFLGWVVRTILMLAFGTSGFAILVARRGAAPDQHSEPGCASGTPADRRYLVISGQLHGPASERPSLFDPESGRLVSIDFPQDDNVTHGTSSPWRDGQGRLTLAANWSRRRNRPDDANTYEFGLARYTVPGGQALDHVVCDLPLIGSPCWYPGSSTRVLYASGDGSLYTYAFGRGTAAQRADESPPPPRPLVWSGPKPGTGPWRIADPSWSTDPRLRGTLLVSLSYWSQAAEGVSQSRVQIWWLRLDTEGTAIVDAGRLMVPDGDEPGDEPIVEAFPSLSATPGGLALACLTRRPNRTGWQLRVGPLEVQPGTGNPRARLVECAVLADDRTGFRPEFSPDGRWVFSVPRVADPRHPIERHSVRVPPGGSRTSAQAGPTSQDLDPKD